MPEHAGEYGYGAREGYPLLPMHPDARMTVIGIVEFRRDGIYAGVVPRMLNPAGQPSPLPLESDDGARVVAYLERLNRQAGLEARWQPGEDVRRVPDVGCQRGRRRLS